MLLFPMINEAGDDWMVSATIPLALRDIKKGEELFVSYLQNPNQSKDDRQFALRGWLAGPCPCTKCERGD